MELFHDRVDIEATRARQYQQSPSKPFSPNTVFEREKTEQWLVPFSEIRFDKEVDWRIYKKERHVYVPLVPYLLPAAPDLALGFMLQLAAGAMASLPGKITKLYVATGDPVNDLQDEEHGRVWQYYVGFAAVTKL